MDSNKVADENKATLVVTSAEYPAVIVVTHAEKPALIFGAFSSPEKLKEALDKEFRNYSITNRCDRPPANKEFTEIGARFKINAKTFGDNVKMKVQIVLPDFVC